MDVTSLLVLVVPGGAALITAAVLLVIRSLSFGVLQRWAERTETEVDDIIIGSLRTPSIYWAIAIGIYVGVSVSELPEKYAFYLTKSIHVLIILSVTIASANLAGRVFTSYVQKVQKLGAPLPSTGLAQGIIKGTILVVGLLVVLGSLGISITPLITALGVGGLAVALAFQDTLQNLFAGVHILVERSIRVGDFIRLETGQEGYVEDITWRTTRIRMLPNNVVIIPNSKLSQSVVTNYSLPEKSMALQIPVGVSYASDPEEVERVLLEEARKAIGVVPGLVGPPEAQEPFVRFIPGFGESSLDFTLTCQVGEFTDQFLVQHELRKRIFKRFREEGIVIPFPRRTVYLRDGKDREKKK